MENKKNGIDKRILITTIILIVVGLVMIASSSWPYAIRQGKTPYNYAIKQAIFSIVGFFVMLIVSKINYKVRNMRESYS